MPVMTLIPVTSRSMFFNISRLTWQDFRLDRFALRLEEISQSFLAEHLCEHLRVTTGPFVSREEVTSCEFSVTNLSITCSA